MTIILAGTSKGLFILRHSADGYEISGPHCGGWPINHAIASPDGHHIWAAGGSGFMGAGVWHSTDGGLNWTVAKLANGDFDRWMMADPAMAAHWGVPVPETAPFSGKVEVLWSLARHGGRLLTGGKPGVMFESRDDGATWAEVAGINAHPDRAEWEPGGAGLVVHTITPHPEDAEKLWIGVSAAGVFATEDGGATWESRNRASNQTEPHDHPHEHAAPHPAHAADEVGLCVHNLQRAQGAGDVLYQQNHHGVFRSHDGGRNWVDISAGLPSRFGFPIAVHPHDPMTVFVLPLNGDTQGRFPPDASCAIWRSRDGGATWARMDKGLPQKNCFFTVLRQGMAITDAPDPLLVFGTNSGSVFASSDLGETWVEAARHLPTVLAIEVVA